MAAACATTLAGGSGSLTIAGLPGRMICAFSRPMASRSLPRYSMWSSAMLVITAQSVSKAFTESKRPPRPTSRITRSSAASDSSRAMARVLNSNWVSAISPASAGPPQAGDAPSGGGEA